MKAFAFSLIALLLLCVIVFFHTMFISKVSNEMQEKASKIEDSPNIETIGELESIWNENKLAISISIPHKETDELEKSLLLLRTKIENRDFLGAQETLSLLMHCIDEVKIHGTVSFDNIF